MTISSTVSGVSYAGNGVTTAFATTFRFDANGDLVVLTRDANGVETIKTIITDYTVTGAANPAGGTVTMVVAPAVGETLDIRRNTPVTQQTDYVPNDPFPAESHERALDKLTMIAQDLDRRGSDISARALRVQQGETVPVLPKASDRINKLLGFDATGQPIMANGSGLGPNSVGTVELVDGAVTDSKIGTNRLKPHPAASSDLNLEIGFGGWSAGPTTLNTPSSNFWKGITIGYSSPNYAEQIAWTVFDECQVWRRRRTNANGWSPWFRDEATSTGNIAQYFGADRTGVASSNAAFVSAIANSSDIVIPAGTWRISSNLTLPAGKTYTFLPGAQITVDVGVTLTIRGVVKADWQQIFAGAGSVVGIRSVRPEWFGALRNGVSNDQPALQKAHDCVMQSIGSDGGRPEITPSSGTYGLAALWTLTPTRSIPLRMRGAGAGLGAGSTVFLALNSFAGSTVAINIQGQSNASAERIANFDIGDFSVQRQSVASAATTGIWVGGLGADKNLVGDQNSLIENVAVYDFVINWRINALRLVAFERCSGWNETVNTPNGCFGLYVTATPLGTFTGDLNFNNCQWANKYLTSSTNVFIHNTAGADGGSSSGINGLSFRRCIFYHADVAMSVINDNGQIGDLWVGDGSQFDGQMGTLLNVQQTGLQAQSFNWHFDDIYGQGLNSYIVFTDIVAGEFADIFLNKWWIRGAPIGALEGFHFAGPMKGIKLINGDFVDVSTTGNWITFFGAAIQVDVSHNLVRDRSGGNTVNNFLVLSATANHYTVVHNNGKSAGAVVANMVVELNGAATKDVGGNI